jgi:predicted RNase H-like HicB family nuclease
MSEFTAAVWQEDDLFIAQCLEVDVASQGCTEEEALANLTEALTLHFEPPVATIQPRLAKVKVQLDAA